MQTIKVELEVPKETKEVIDLIDAIVEKAMAKADISEYTNLLPQLMTALDGVQGIAAEMKSNYKDEAAAYLLHKLLGRLLADSGEELPDVTG